MFKWAEFFSAKIWFICYNNLAFIVVKVQIEIVKSSL